MPKSHKQILHIISTLERGGAQEVLKTVCNSGPRNISHHILYMDSRNSYSPSDFGSGVSISDLKVSGIKSFLIAAIRLSVFFRKSASFNCIQGWMYHGNLFALFIKLFNPSAPILFSIHNGSDQRNFTSLSGYIASRVCGYFSALASFTVFVSNKSKNSHIPYRNSVVIPNPLKFLHNCVPSRDLEGIAVSPVVTLAFLARFDPIKNIGFLLDMVQQLKCKGLNIGLLMAGEGMTPQNFVLMEMIRCRTLEDNIELMGVLSDVSIVYNRADFTILTSKCESFSNVLLESIAYGTPFISSDVGIAKDLLTEDSLVMNGYDLHSWVNAVELKLRVRKTPEISSRVRLSYLSQSAVYAPERIAALYSDCWSKAMGL